MSNRNSDTVFQLVHSLKKSEKRHFKLYIKRSSAKEELKVVLLFDLLERAADYDEAALLKKMPGVRKPQLYNLKAHLYKELLASLRLLNLGSNIDLQLSELVDEARILYNKGLKIQALRILEKAKDLARTHQKFNTLVQILSLEKKIETLHITRTSSDKTAELARESLEVSAHIDRVTRLSNLALLLYHWYIQHGHARNTEDESKIKSYFRQSMPFDQKEVNGFYEKLYLFQSYCWYAFIRQDFLMYYRYSKKWIDLYESDPVMIEVETGHYIKGMHNLLNAHFDLRNHIGFEESLHRFEAFEATAAASQHENFRTHTSIYINSARLNRHLMQGTFYAGTLLIPDIEKKLNEYALFVDRHRILVFTYKFASLCFGCGDYSKAIDHLLKIINGPMDLRIDLQCYARLMHLISHYELGNFELMESLSKSAYRFMAKMKNLTQTEEEVFRFLRTSLKWKPEDIKPELQKLLVKIKHLEKDRHETRGFAYLDIISWIESKVYHKTMEAVIHEKYLHSKKRNYKKS
ncbi:MAG: hypothetical protein RL732_19 [Bacteroidota bacterium]|jgi:hypothetical protein